MLRKAQTYCLQLESSGKPPNSFGRVESGFNKGIQPDGWEPF